jgi:hypothetical protein
VRYIKIAFIAAASGLMLVPAGFGAAITVVNPSFETLPAGGLTNGCGTNCSYSGGVAIPGWTSSNPATGQFDPGPPATTTYFNSVPDGLTIAYGDGATVSQTVIPTVQLGVTYTLMVDIGVRKDLPDLSTVYLSINGSHYVGTGTAASPGNWAVYTATYTGLASDVGDAITIVLDSTNTSGQGDWDNVLLNSSVATVPEPASLSMIGLGLAGLAALVRRRRSLS